MTMSGVTATRFAKWLALLLSKFIITYIKEILAEMRGFFFYLRLVYAEL